MEQMLVTIPEMASMLGCSRAFGYGLIQKGELPTVKLGRARRVPVAEVHRYIERLQQEKEETAQP